ncbi:hypothetical protein SPRG_08021 [Saprolegnia parasitica CBS 223.65]|uniref:Kinesin motor domain-containing protein n=1 Tax=Saprolegnia parasitica (strain CBS 223.65) TaxID=695850 RepID=A0A067CIJ5_SAPPC|nr:hypothetical protein SPRG_08021 [Saprolegnia parasitica CBS 223.65]KDO26617.1 hypothetical protein SPRG_08021 [Saprolegnia parasitica CBS 223.65]|eukprot:XP_012202758.1 hypothetical protein SPRG_08021 [Saprolegnia parasitica CBS 223.65]
MEENIDVCIRVRPLNEREKRNKDVSVLRVLPALNAISITDRHGTPLQGPTAVFQYDHIFQQRVPTSTIYDQVAKRIVLSTLMGVNGTIFAYGQTSSGKTHTMTGEAAEPGILPLAVQHIFQYIADSTDRDFLIRVSYVEIYNEVIRDLLCDDKDKGQNVKIREDPKKGIYLEAHEEFITDFDTIMRLVDQGNARRAVGQTSMNEHSSRSHSIFQIVIESKERGPEKDDGVAYLVGVLNLVDLAGSESVRHTSSEGARQREAGNINRSLLTLARVINSLAQGPESVQNAPFRDSKLTRLLQNSLAGSTRTLIICCVTPSDRHLEESKSTLQFAARAKTIQMSATVNEVLDDHAQMQRLQREVNELRKKLLGDVSFNALLAENQALSEEKRRQQEKIERLQGLIVTGRASLEPIDMKKTKTKRARETWGPGEIAAVATAARHGFTTYDEEEKEEGSVAKKRKGRYSEGSVVDAAIAIEHARTVELLKRELAQVKLALEDSKAQPPACAHCIAADESVRDFEALLETMSADRANLKEKLTASEAAVAELQASVDASTSTIASLEEKLDEQTKIAAAFEELLENASQTRNDLEEAYNDEVEKVKALEAQVGDVEKVASLQSRLEEQNHYMEELEKTHAHLRLHYESELEALRGPPKEPELVAQLQSALDEAENKLTQALADAAAAQEKWELQIQALQSENEALASANDSAQDAAAIQMEKEAIQFQLEALQRQLDAELERRVDDDTEWAAKVDQLTQDVTTLAEQLQAEKDDKAAVENALTTQLQSIEKDLETALSEHSRAMLAARESTASTEAIARLLEEDLLSAKTAHHEVESGLRQQIADAETRATAAAAARVALEEDLAVLQGKLQLAEGSVNDQVTALSTQVHALLHEKAELEAKLIAAAEITTQLETLQHEKTSMCSAMEALELSLAEAQDKVTRLGYLETQAFEEKQALQVRVQELTSDLEQLTSTRATTASEEAAALQSALYTLQVEHQALTEQIQRLEQDKHMLETSVASDHALHASRITSLEDKIRTLAQELVEAASVHVAEMTAQSSVWADERTSLKSAIATLEASVREKDDAIEAHGRTMAKLEETLEANQDAMYAQRVAQHQALSAAEAALATANEHVAALMAANEALEAKAAGLDAKVDELQAQLDVADVASTQVRTLQDDKSHLAAQVARLTTALEEEAYEKSVLEKDLDEVRATLAEMETDRSKVQRSLELDAEQQIAQVVEEKGMLYEQIEGLQADYKHIQKELELVKASERSLRQEHTAVRDELDVARSRITKLELVKMTKHHLEIFQTLKLDNKKKTQEIASLSAKLAAIPTTSEAEVRELEARLRAEHAKRSDLEDKVTELSLSVKTMQNEVKIKAAESSALQSTIEQYEVQLQELDDELRRSKEALQASEEAAKASADSEPAYLVNENLQLHYEVKHLKKLLEDYSPSALTALQPPVAPPGFTAATPAKSYAPVSASGRKLTPSKTTPLRSAALLHEPAPEPEAEKPECKQQ